MLNFCTNVACILVPFFFIIFHKLLWQTQHNTRVFTKFPYISMHSNTFLGYMCIWLLIGKIVLIFQCPNGEWKICKTNRSFIISPKQLHFSILKWLTPFCDHWCTSTPVTWAVWGLGRHILRWVGQMEAPVSHEPEARPLQIPFHVSLDVLSWICMKIKFISSATALIRNFVVVIVLFELL